MGTMKKKDQRPAAPQPNSMVASAAQLKPAVLRNFRRHGNDTAWQETAYRMYKQVAEFRYACDWVGNQLSKAILYAAHRNTDGSFTPVEDGLAHEYMEDLFGGPEGRTEMLRSLGIHMTIGGEAYVVGYDNPDPYSDDPYVWQVVAPHKLRTHGENSFSIDGERIDVPLESALVIRIWRPDPENGNDAVSPARPLIPILSEIIRLTQHVSAQVDSRLAGAGILVMPSEMEFPPPPEDDGGAEGESAAVYTHANNAESLMATITNAMSKSIDNRDDASALVPIVITAPQDAISSIQHLTFWSELDRQAIDLRSEAIRRLALGMDMPPEVLQGSADANHWAAWQSDESAIKAHTEPLLKLLTTALSEGYLRPILHAADDGTPLKELRNYAVMADTADMRLRPNRSKEALELYDRGEVSGDTLRRETGFDNDDAMDKDELVDWFRRQVAGGSTTPELVASALEQIGLDVPGGATVPEDETQEGRPSPSLKDHEERTEPDREEGERRKEIRDTPPGQMYSLAEASNQIVIRAFERAGNKLKNRMKDKPRVPASELYSFVTVDNEEMSFLLDDAWSHLPDVAQRHGIQPEKLEASLESYARSKMTAASEHTFDDLVDHLTAELEDA